MKLAFEAIAQPASEPETEITIYARIGNMDGLKQAQSKEGQIQVTARLGESNFCRVRRSEKEGKIDYVFMFKTVATPDGSAIAERQEYPVVVNEAFYKGFLAIADKVQTKTRYVFDSTGITIAVGEGDHTREIEVPGVIYEVDVYTRPDGTISPWCKIDVEVDKVFQFLAHNYPDLETTNFTVKVTHLPFEPSRPVVDEAGVASVKALIEFLYEHEFTRDLVKERQSKGE